MPFWDLKKGDIEKSRLALGDKISAGSITALSIDTTTFSDKKFRDRNLLRLAQLPRLPLRFVVSEVVKKEIRRQYFDEVQIGRARFVETLQDPNRASYISNELAMLIDPLLQKMPTAEDIVDRKVEDFFSCAGAIILQAGEYSPITAVLDMYFQRQAPFHIENPKQKEFPDAIALISLENWVTQNNTEAIVVSNDKAWEQFCANSTKLHLVKYLYEALTFFPSPNERTRILKAEIVKQLKDTKTPLYRRCRKAIEDYSWEDRVIEGSNYPFRLSSRIRVKINELRLDADSLQESASVEKNISFVCTFSVVGTVELDLAFYDSDDLAKPFATKKYTQKFETVAPVFIYIPRDGFTIDSAKIEVYPEKFFVDFGMISPT